MKRTLNVTRNKGNSPKKEEINVKYDRQRIEQP